MQDCDVSSTSISVLLLDMYKNVTFDSTNVAMTEMKATGLWEETLLFLSSTSTP